LICAILLWVISEIGIALYRSKGTRSPYLPTHNRRFIAVLLGGLAFAGHSNSIQTNRVEVSEEKGLPVELALTPVMATLLLRNILQQRREQIRRRIMPDVMSADEVELLSEVQQIASSSPTTMVTSELDHSSTIVKVLSEAVNRLDETEVQGSENPIFVVRLYGYPEVESREGVRATFRKKRALELLVWITLNRDRPRRSAARTALWQIDVSDATFSTVVSDMRRALSDLDSSVNRAELLPTTYSDELLLSNRITTDFELLRESLMLFRENHSNHRLLADQLAEIRDVPFSGTSYEWADLDGTTTRLIITAMQASQELAEYAKSIGDVDLMTVAVSAGLRVMPGCEELLQIQEQFLTMKMYSRSTG
jgi:two-component SAPR family response regulator